MGWRPIYQKHEANASRENTTSHFVALGQIVARNSALPIMTKIEIVITLCIMFHEGVCVCVNEIL
mgnify:FL=1